MKDKFTILVTGGAGFVGSNLCIGIKNKYQNYTIIAFDNLKRRGSELNLPRLKEAGVVFLHGDVRNKEDFDGIPTVDLLIEASADPSVLSGINTPVYPLLNHNLIGTINCLEFSQKNNAAFIFLSTSRVYPVKKLESCSYTESETRFSWTDNQVLHGVSSKGITEEFSLEGSRSFYGASKLASELLITEYNELKGLKTVVNRCGVISGPWQMGKIDQGVVALWMAAHFFKTNLTYIGYEGKGKQVRDVLSVSDLVALIDLQIHNLDKVNGKTYNVGGGQNSSFSLCELTSLCAQLTGNKINIDPVKETRPADIRIYLSDCEKIYTETGWKPTKSLEQLASDLFEWIKNNEKIVKPLFT